MRDLQELDRFRRTDAAITELFGWPGDGRYGLFEMPYAGVGELLRVIATVGGGWDHVSVSTEHRCPTWTEMDWVKRLFFRPDETAMQLHVPAADHVNLHPYCLHLWRPLDRVIPRPPSRLVDGAIMPVWRRA